MTNQRNLQRLSKMVGRRLQGDFIKSTENRSIIDKANPVTGDQLSMMGKQKFNRAKQSNDGVSNKYKMQDAFLSEQVKHAQKEALRRFIGQVIEQEYVDKKIASEFQQMNDAFDKKKEDEKVQRQIKELVTENERSGQRTTKQQMFQTQENYRKNVPDIEGNLGYPRLEHMTSSQELKKTRFDQKFFMGDLDNQLDLKRKRMAEDRKKEDTYYCLQNDVDAVGDQHYTKAGFFGSRAASQGRQRSTTNASSYNKASVLNIGHPSTFEKQQAESETREKHTNLLIEWEKQNKIKQIQSKIQSDLNVTVTQERLPQALTETKTELKNMLTAQPFHQSSEYYEQMLNLNGEATSPRQVASRDQLRVRDMMPAPSKPVAEKDGRISRDSTKPGSVAKRQAGHRSQLAKRPKGSNDDDRVKTPVTNTTLNAASLERLSKLHEMHQKLNKAKQSNQKSGVKSDNQYGTKEPIVMKPFNPKGASNPAVTKSDAISERNYPWENRALGQHQIELKKIVKNY